jgi:hypothetical protein
MRPMKPPIAPVNLFASVVTFMILGAVPAAAQWSTSVRISDFGLFTPRGGKGEAK